MPSHESVFLVIHTMCSIDLPFIVQNVLPKASNEALLVEM